MLLGCARNIHSIPLEFRSTDSIIVGRIETVPVLWEFSLYEENSDAEDRVDIEGESFGLTKAGKLQNQGYLFKMASPGTYTLRLQKGFRNHDDILRFDVPKGSLVYFHTIRVVIDRVEPSFQGGRTSKGVPLAFKYHYEHIDEDETLRHFADQYPQAYSLYKDKVIRVPSRSRPKLLASFRSDRPLRHQRAGRFRRRSGCRRAAQPRGNGFRHFPAGPGKRGIAKLPSL